jgi:hypothetical protein
VATAELDVPGYPFFLQEDPASPNPIYYSAQDFRNYTAAFQRRPGVLGSSHFLVTQADNIGFKVKVNSGYANVGGYYIVYLPNDVEVPLTWTTPATGTATHKVFIVVYDELWSGTVNKAQILISQDTGAGAPYPTGTAAYLELATITVTSTQSNIQNQHIANIAQHGGSAGPYVLLAPYLTAGHESGGSPGGGAPIRAIYDSGFVRLSGSVQRGDGNPFAKDTEIHFCTMHPNLRPTHSVFLTGVASVSTTGPAGTLTFRLSIYPDGRMTARVPATDSPANQSVKYLTIDGLTYDLD